MTDNCCGGDLSDRQPDPGELIAIFNRLFKSSENTELVRGSTEPVYLPADQENRYHRVIFAHGFFASALHEIAHWCIAGRERRLCIDYGYWYAPDGRDADQQRAFERVEVKPQALEWILSRACNKPFRISIDNLNGVSTDSTLFKQRVYQQVLAYCRNGLPDRAQQLVTALQGFYRTAEVLQPGNYQPREIGLDAFVAAESVL